MSSDNYLYVRRWHGVYYIEHRFASLEYDDKTKPADKSTPYLTAALAVHAAHARDAVDYSEYGVSLAPDVLADLERQ